MKNVQHLVKVSWARNSRVWKNLLLFCMHVGKKMFSKWVNRRRSSSYRNLHFTSVLLPKITRIFFHLSLFKGRCRRRIFAINDDTYNKPQSSILRFLRIYLSEMLFSSCYVMDRREASFIAFFLFFEVGFASLWVSWAWSIFLYVILTCSYSWITQSNMENAKLAFLHENSITAGNFKFTEVFN